MKRSTLVALAVVFALAAVAGIGFALYERNERSGLVKKSEQSCAERDEPAAGAPSSLPLGLPTTGDSEVLNVTTQGKTTVAFAKISGGRDDIVEVRDRVLADLQSAGYTTVGTDQEPGYEAEAELGGTHSGTLKVSPLCEGLLEIRYKIEQ